MIGWFCFLAESMIKDPDKLSKPERKQSTCFQNIQSYALNSLIAFLLLASWGTSNPAWVWSPIAPKWLSPYLNAYNSASFWVRENLEPLMITLGCYQSEWLIFAGGTEGYTDVRWFAGIDVLKGNGKWEKVFWSSPDWHSMLWWEKKRHQRGMLFFENMALDNPHAKASKERLCELLLHSLQYTQGKSVIPGAIIDPTSEADLISLLSNAQAFNLTLELVTSIGPSHPPSDMDPWDVPSIRPELITKTYEAHNLIYLDLTAKDQGMSQS
jgi:hypothetical protein